MRYDRTEPLGMFFRSVGSLFFMWERGTLLNEDFRALDEAAVTGADCIGRGSPGFAA